MALTRADKDWIAKTVRRILAEVIAAEATQLGGYDGATSTDEGEYEQGKKKPRVGFLR